MKKKRSKKTGRTARVRVRQPSSANEEQLARVHEQIAWLESLKITPEREAPLSGDHGEACAALLGGAEIQTKGGSADARLCFEMAKPDRGLVRIKSQTAAVSDPVGKVSTSTWIVTQLGRDVAAEYRKRRRKAEIRKANKSAA